MSVEPNDENVKRLFEQMALIMASEPTVDGLAAAQDFYSAMICLAAPDKPAALEMARQLNADVLGTVMKNFDWYRTATQPGHPSGRG